ncbi:hypothetical protein ABEY41_00220 [Peribacillus butanolivorans]|uniref:hypothetical protein n=1 Tax=Peribacillus butanolivorans TaxID=421767 RepID=UPI003D2D4BFD
MPSAVPPIWTVTVEPCFRYTTTNVTGKAEANSTVYIKASKKVIGSAKARVKAHSLSKSLNKKLEKTCISMPIFLCSWECSIEVNFESGLEVGK